MKVSVKKNEHKKDVKTLRRTDKLQFSDLLLLAHDYNWWKQEQDKKVETGDIYEEPSEIIDFMLYIRYFLDIKKVKKYIADNRIDFNLPFEAEEDDIEYLEDEED